MIKTNQLWCAKLSIVICVAAAAAAAADDDDDDVSARLHVAKQRYSAITDWPRRRPRDDDVITSPSTVKRYWPDRSRHVTPSSQSGNLQVGDGQLTKSAHDQTANNKFTIF